MCVSKSRRGKKVSCNFWPVWVSLKNLYICLVENVVLYLIKGKIVFTRPWRGEEFPNFPVSFCWGRHVVSFGVWETAKIGSLEVSGRESGEKRVSC